MRRCNGRPRRSPSSGLAFLRYAGPSPCFGLRLKNFWMHSSIIASNPAKTASTQRKRYRSGSCQLMFCFSATQGGKRRQREPRGRLATGKLRHRCRHRIGSIRARAGLVGSRQTSVHRRQRLWRKLTKLRREITRPSQPSASTQGLWRHDSLRF